MPAEMSLPSGTFDGALVRGLALGACLAATMVGMASAQNLPPGPAYHTARAVRIEQGQAPMIDGNLSDPIWANAEIIDQLYQDQPNPGEPATVKTVTRILFDEDTIYFGIYAYDDEPQDIVARAMSRDGDMATSDNVRIVLDPGLTRRNGYSFQVSAAGGRRDGLVQNNATFLYEWNAIWIGKAKLVDDGYTVEIAIPFRTVAYDPDQSDWGLEIGRTVRHKNENLVWSGYNPMFGAADISQAGTLTGISGGASGIGLDVQVYATARLRNVAQGTEGTDLSGTAGGNAYYKITPALTGTLTFNPDFSDSPLDTRQVNTTRFSLFIDETRDFFLQDAAAFEFGGYNFINDSNNGRPFFSRNIGLVSGRPVSIIGGAKVSGEVGGFGIGALSVVTAAQATAPEQVLSVARISRPILDESRIGFVVTHGDPTGATDNTVLGADFQYRNSHLFGSDVALQSDLYYERSFSDVYGEDDSFGVAFNFPDEPWGGRLRFKQVGEDFRPALGFANRRGTRRYEGRISRRDRFRNFFLRENAYSYEGEVITGLDNRIQSWLGQGQIVMESRSNDRLSLRTFSYYENVDIGFDLPRGVPIPAGSYGWDNYGARIETSPTRVIQFSIQGECCRFYNGNGYKLESTLTWRPNRYFEISPSYEGEFIRLRTGDVDIHIVTLESVVNFLPDMQLSVEVQWDNISEAFAFSGRYVWEYSPGNELFIGLGHSATLPSLNFRDFEPQVTLLTVRFGRTFQF